MIFISRETWLLIKNKSMIFITYKFTDLRKCDELITPELRQTFFFDLHTRTIFTVCMYYSFNVTQILIIV